MTRQDVVDALTTERFAPSPRPMLRETDSEADQRHRREALIDALEEDQEG